MKEKNGPSFKNLSLDKKDRLILYELGLNGRAPLAQIAKKVGISRQNARYRLSNLIKRGVIRKFITFMDYSKFDYYNYDVWVSLNSVPEKMRQEFVSYFMKHQNVLWLSEYLGKWDFCLALVARNVGHFYELFNEILEKFPKLIRDYLVISIVDAQWYSRSHIAGSSAPRSIICAWKSNSELVRLDAIDKRILGVISEEARLPTQEISRRLKLDPATVSRRMKKLEQNGVIQGYGALIEAKFLGLTRFELPITLRGMNLEKEKTLKEFCLSNPYVFLYIRYVGKWDVTIGLEVKDTVHLQSIISELRQKLPDSIVDYDVLPIVKDHRQKSFPGSLV